MRLGRLLRPAMWPVVLGKPKPLSICECAAALTEGPVSDAIGYLQELEGDASFWGEINDALQTQLGRGYVTDGLAEFLYIVTRIAQPSVFIETGVMQGSSSACILRAMDRNGAGKLTSIDLPARTAAVSKNSTDMMGETLLPPGRDPGWIVPEGLKVRWTLHMGDARDLLRGIVQQAGPVDIFLHDSLHTREHMHWEYETAWPHIPTGGYLLSDDIFDNSAMHEFSRRMRLPYVQACGKFGGIRKRPGA